MSLLTANIPPLSVGRSGRSSETLHGALQRERLGAESRDWCGHGLAEAVSGPRLWRRMESSSGRGWAGAGQHSELSAASRVHTCRVATTHHPPRPPPAPATKQTVHADDSLLQF